MSPLISKIIQSKILNVYVFLVREKTLCMRTREFQIDLKLAELGRQGRREMQCRAGGPRNGRLRL